MTRVPSDSYVFTPSRSPSLAPSPLQGEAKNERAAATRQIILTAAQSNGQPARPQRDASKFQMRPGERDADDRHREQDRGDEMAARQPKAGEHEPDNVTDEPEQPRAEIVAAGMFGARYCFAAERQQRVRGDVERSAGPGNPDNRDRHDNGGDHPGDGHPQTAEYDP